MKQQKIKTSLIEPNDGQLEGLPVNPRRWSPRELQKLAKSIEDTPELLELRPLIVKKHADKYVTIGGNMRLAALKYLNQDTADCVVLPADTPVKTLKEMVLKDNAQFGSWDPDRLANEWDDMPLDEWGLPFTILPDPEPTANASAPDNSTVVEIAFTPDEFGFVTSKLRTLGDSYEAAVINLLKI